MDRGRVREAGFEEVGRDGETRVVGIGSLPQVLEPLRNPMGGDGLEEETFGVMPEEGKPEGGFSGGKGPINSSRGKERRALWMSEEGWEGTGGMMNPGGISEGSEG